MVRPGQTPVGRHARRAGAGLTAALLLAVAVSAAPFAQDIRFFRIGTGATGASYFAIGGVIASAVSNPPGSRPCERGGSCGVPGLIAVAQTTQGSVENVEAIGAGALESGLSQADIAYSAFTGANVFKKSGPIANLRAIANLYLESLHIVVRADSGIESVAGLKGKRVSLGEKASGTVVTARLVLSAYGLNEKKVKPEYLAIGPAVDALRAGKIDAFFMVAGHPVPAIADLAQSTDIRLLPVNGKTAEAFREKYPFLTLDLIPEGTYRGVGATITLGVGALWLVAADLEEDLVYGLTRALWHKSTRKLLDEGNPIGRKIRLETALVGIPIPLHPGAQRYYAEASAAAEQAQPPAE